jgi:hypothetical protein
MYDYFLLLFNSHSLKFRHHTSDFHTLPSGAILFIAMTSSTVGCLSETILFSTLQVVRKHTDADVLLTDSNTSSRPIMYVGSSSLFLSLCPRALIGGCFPCSPAAVASAAASMRGCIAAHCIILPCHILCPSCARSA